MVVLWANFLCWCFLVVVMQTLTSPPPAAAGPPLTPADITACVYSIIGQQALPIFHWEIYQGWLFVSRGFNRGELQMESGCAERRARWGSGWKYSLLEDIQGMSERKMISKKLVSPFFLCCGAFHGKPVILHRSLLCIAQMVTNQKGRRPQGVTTSGHIHASIHPSPIPAFLGTQGH